MLKVIDTVHRTHKVSGHVSSSASTPGDGNLLAAALCIPDNLGLRRHSQTRRVPSEGCTSSPLFYTRIFVSKLKNHAKYFHDKLTRMVGYRIVPVGECVEPDRILNLPSDMIFSACACLEKTEGDKKVK